MKTLVWILAVALAALSATSAPAQDRDAPTAEIRELQKQRIAVLKEVAETSQTLVHRDRVDIMVAVEDRMALLRAESEAAPTETDRASLDKQALESLAAYQELAQARKEAARGTQIPIDRIALLRLEIEQRLEPAKAKDLQKQRVALLEGLTDVTTRLAQSGRTSPTEQFEAKLRLFQAEREGEETEADRAAAAKKMVDTLTAYQDFAQAQKAAARGNQLTVLRIQARRLEVESSLDPAKAKELQTERIAIFKSLAEGAALMFRDGRITAAESYDAKLLVLDAEAKAAAKSADRIPFEQERVNVLKEYEAVVSAQGAAGASPDQVGLQALRVAAQRLEAEIRLKHAQNTKD